MAKVNLDINGRRYSLVCDDGEEERLLMLGGKLDTRVRTLADQFGQIGDLRLMLMAGITLLDELEDSSESVDAKAESMASELRKASEDAISLARKREGTAADSLVEAAERIERLAARLSRS